MNAADQPRNPKWIPATSSVFVALLQSRRALRAAASKAEDRGLAHRLRRLARRRRAAAQELKRLAPPAAEQALTAEPETWSFANEVHTASEIGAVAACLRANRRLRANIETALGATPPQAVRNRLEAMRSQADRDAALFHSRLRELVAVAIPVGPETPAVGAAARS